jgi:hypothetical protein
MSKLNVKTNLIHALLIGASAFILTGCKKEPEAQKISEFFQNQILKFLQSSSKLDAASSNGISKRDFTSILDDIRGDYELCTAMWHDGFAPHAKAAFQEALEAWDFTERLWSSKLKYPESESDADIYQSSYQNMSSDFKKAIPAQKVIILSHQDAKTRVADCERYVREQEASYLSITKTWEGAADIPELQKALEYQVAAHREELENRKRALSAAKELLDKPSEYKYRILYSSIPACLSYASDKFEAARKELLAALN